MDKNCNNETDVKKIANALDIEHQNVFRQLRFLSHMSEDIILRYFEPSKSIDKDVKQLTNIFSNLKQNEKDKILNLINSNDEFTFECTKCSFKNGYLKREVDTLDISKLKTVLYATGILQ